MYRTESFRLLVVPLVPYFHCYLLVRTNNGEICEARGRSIARPPDVTRVYDNLVVLPFDRVMLNLDSIPRYYDLLGMLLQANSRERHESEFDGPLLETIF